MTGPQDPFTPMAAMAVMLHETYLAYVEAGFTDDQALQLLAGMLQAVATATMMQGEQ